MLLMSSSSPSEKKLAAKLFANKWADRGNEKSDTHSFWLELLRDVVGMEDVTTNVRFESRTSQRGYIDVVIQDAKTFIEQNPSMLVWTKLIYVRGVWSLLLDKH